MERINIILLLLLLLVSCNLQAQYYGSHDCDSICEYEYFLSKRNNRQLKTFGQNSWSSMDKCHPLFSSDIFSCKLDNDTLIVDLAVSTNGRDYLRMSTAQLNDSTLCICFIDSTLRPTFRITADSVLAPMYDPIVDAKIYSVTKKKDDKYRVDTTTQIQTHFTGCTYLIKIPNFIETCAIAIEHVSTYYQTIIEFRKIIPRE